MLVREPEAALITVDKRCPGRTAAEQLRATEAHHENRRSERPTASGGAGILVERATELWDRVDVTGARGLNLA